MAEALAVVGLVSAIVQFVDFSTKVIRRIDELRSKNNEIPMVFNDISVQIPLLVGDLNQTKNRAERSEISLDVQSAVLAVVQSCHAHVITLDGLLTKVLPDSADSSWRLAKKALLSIHQEEKIRFIAQELRDNVIYLTHHSTNVIAQRDLGTKLVQVDEQMKMLQWLSITDPSVYHNRAIRQREPGTGQWLLQSESLHRWKSLPRGLGWLYGIPGCGKTILCAAVIEAMKEYCKLSKSRVLAYHYIDFNDTSNAKVDNILRSLIRQICVSMDTLPVNVQALCSQHRASGHQPSITSLVSILRALETELALQIFIVIDALDEYPERERLELLQTIQSLIGKDFQYIRIFVTSRAEHDIKATIGDLATEAICVESSQVDADIKLHIRACLLEDPRLSKLPERISNLVEAKLGEGSQGMFRWAVCQIDTLRSCNKASAVKAALEDLPKSLYDTYERVLSHVARNDLADARAIMLWIAFAKRPLALEEIAEAATTKPGLEDTDPDDKLYDPHDVLRICRSLICLSEAKITVCGKLEIRQVVRFAHASVREYLLSDHVAKGSAASFALSEKASHEQITKCCLSVLLRNNMKHKILPDPDVMPLLRYAAEYWFQHVQERSNVEHRAMTQEDLNVEDLVIKLFDTSITVFRNWLAIYDPNTGRGSNGPIGSGPSPIYYAALLGLCTTTRRLLNLGYNINVHGGRYGTALVVAASQGDEAMVRLLVNQGADVNCFGGLAFRSSLEAACSSGSEPIVRLLLNQGAQVNPKIQLQWAKHDTALQEACGYENLVRLLIESGADINAQAGGYGNALQAAAAKGHYAVTALLLDNGAKVNAQGGHYGTALQAAVARGSESVTRMLLDAGANPNIQAGGFRDALRAAAWRSELSIFRLLIERGADAELSVQGLENIGEKPTSVEDKWLLKKVHASKGVTEDISTLKESVRAAAIRIAQIEKEKRAADQVASERFLHLNRGKIRAFIRETRKRNMTNYQFGLKPKSWLTAAKDESEKELEGIYQCYHSSAHTL